jgi:hypothetical protein
MKKQIEYITFKEHFGQKKEIVTSEMFYNGEKQTLSYSHGYNEMVQFKEACAFVDTGNEYVFTLNPSLNGRKEIKLGYDELMTLQEMIAALELTNKIDSLEENVDIHYIGNITKKTK